MVVGCFIPVFFLPVNFHQQLIWSVLLFSRRKTKFDLLYIDKYLSKQFLELGWEHTLLQVHWVQKMVCAHVLFDSSAPPLIDYIPLTKQTIY